MTTRSLYAARSLVRAAHPRPAELPSSRFAPALSPRPRAFSASHLAREAPQATDGEKALKSKLEEKLQGAKVDVQDVSGGCGSFYAISVEHEAFKGLTMIKQHRLVNDLLKDDIKDMHGLQLKTKAP
ncbi:hypothetical protein BMF94_2321 [Rhodotorula taiwanensis]|uniref:Bola-like protein n=1 Tax=Rhodotorula taiwanensis TaxID=741276 RepID=A0A2S5BCQ8_9BASI|nr:hypothetical protein BMF94_2321 [Rhodotorula taiwanensis]